MPTELCTRSTERTVSPDTIRVASSHSTHDEWPPRASRPLRILEVVNEFPPTVGGSETHNISEVDFLCRRGHSVCVLVPRNVDHLSDNQYDEATQRQLDRSHWTWSPQHHVPVYEARDCGRSSLLSWARLHRRLSQQHGPFDVVVAHRSHYLPAFASARRLVLTLHYLELACPNFMDAPLCSMSADGSCDCFAQRSAWRNAKWWARRRLSRRLMDAVVTKYPIIEEKLAASGIERDKIRLVPNWIDTRPFDGGRQAWPGMPEAFDAWRQEASAVFTFLGRLVPDHGSTAAVEAFLQLAKREPASRLMIVGDGPEGPELRRRVAASGVHDRVCFLGWVEREHVPAVLSWCDFGLATSDWDNYHWRLLELMAAGLPVIAVDAGHTHRAIQHNATGYLCGPRVDDIAATMQHALAHVAQAERLGHAARDHIEQRFSLRNLLEYERVLYGDAVA